MSVRIAILAVIIQSLAISCLGQTTLPAGHPPTTSPAHAAAGQPPIAPEGAVANASITQHQVMVGQRAIQYRATAAMMLMKDEAGKAKADMFFVAYEKLGENEPGRRPITFVFNGGPGAAAVWLHLGTAGPKRINLGPEGEAPAPPYRLVDNPYTWLDVTDLVFVDPVGTGFSRPAPGEQRQEFYGVKEDVRWMADFIRLYITIYQRWDSPKFLAGESYGTTRAAGLSEYLLDQYGISLNGIMLLSSILDFQTIQPGGVNDLPYVLYLPSYAAAAWYHKKLPADLQASLDKTLQEVQQWAVSDYYPALAKGDTLAAEQRQAVVQKLSRYTSLPADLIDKSNLRIDPGIFEKQLLADQGKTIGRFDARITGPDLRPAATRAEYDPSLSRYLPIYSATFNNYVRRTLKYESTLPYEVLTEKVFPWNFGQSGQGYLSVMADLRSAMTKSPYLKVLFASGYFDLATPYYSANYTIDHLKLSPQLRGNITHTFYASGHMVYHPQAGLEKLKKDVASFIGAAMGQEQ